MTDKQVYTAAQIAEIMAETPRDLLDEHGSAWIGDTGWCHGCGAISGHEEGCEAEKQEKQYAARVRFALTELVDAAIYHAKRADEAEAALARAREVGRLTWDELIVACRNIGYDLTCGACAGLFYTGMHLGEAHTCSDANSAHAVVSVSSENTAENDNA